MRFFLLFLQTALTTACDLSDNLNVGVRQFSAFRLTRQPHFKGKPFEGLTVKLKQNVVFPTAHPGGEKKRQ